MQVLELVSERGLTALHCHCRPRPSTRPARGPTFTLAAGVQICVRCPACGHNAAFALPHRTRIAVDLVDENATQSSAARASFLALRSGGFSIHVVGRPRADARILN
jgi:hypothetical protein